MNGTTIQYKNLKVPCCQSCNNEHLSRLEGKISKSVEKGYECAKATQAIDWYYWAGKIFYSILRKEFTLLSDRKNPDCGTILDSDALKSFSNLHLFLQGIRGKHKFEGKPPFSILLCNVHDLGNLKNYDFKDDLAQFALSIRMGEVGLIVCFQDFGLSNSTYGKYVQSVGGQKLHPIQFDELYSKTSYQLYITDWKPTFLTASHTGGVYEATTQCFPSYHVGSWNQEEFVNWLLTHVHHWFADSPKLEDHYQPPDLVTTWMVDQTGELLILPLEEWQSNSSYAS